jgi:diaminopimelate decarboxylase
MTTSSEGYAQRLAELLKQPTPLLDRQELEAFVQKFIKHREIFLRLVKNHGSPLYALDLETLTAKGRQFLSVFAGCHSAVRPYYAVKSNNHPEIARTLVGLGFGLDVSSGLELEMALECGAGAIIFSGPGKVDDELDLAVSHPDSVTLLLDSFAELDRVERMAAKRRATIRAGIRLTTQESGIWRKFGVPLDDLVRFFEAADRCEHVRLRGMQFHISWNLNPENQVRFLSRLGTTLRDLDQKHRLAIEFLDVGGGYWPPEGEWLQPAATSQGILSGAVGESPGRSTDHFIQAAVPLEEFSARIRQAIAEHLPADLNFTLCCEPGRWLCHEAMHILVTVVDRKAPDLVITDAGTNAVGWERFENDFFPVINLTRPSTAEQECLVAGSLCTPHDLWGYSYFGEDIQPGDLLLIPNQGAYTYSLKQHFIKPLPRVVVMNGTSSTSLVSRGQVD